MAKDCGCKAKKGKKISVIGCGNWGSAVVKIVAENAQRFPEFQTEVNLYVHEEEVDGKKLSEIINETHENVKYLPGVKLPNNIKAISDLKKATEGCEIWMVIVPYHYLPPMVEELKSTVKPTTIGVSFIKGIHIEKDKIQLLTDYMSEKLGIPFWAVMGANIAHEVAEERYCETIIGCTNPCVAQLLVKALDRDYFKTRVVPDIHTIEACGALKTIVSCACGFADGQEMGMNFKATVLGLGLREMIRFIEEHWPGDNIRTYFESCGVPDLVTSCFAGRNYWACVEFSKSNKTIKEVEKDMFKGQKVGGFRNSKDISEYLNAKNAGDRFPFFKLTNDTLNGTTPVSDFPKIVAEIVNNKH